jgi:hypothetical protein
MGAPLFNNPRLQRYGAPLFTNPNTQLRDASFIQQMSGYGRGAYRVPSRYVRSPYAYGPLDERGVSPPRIKRKAYRVKAKRNTPKMKKAQARFKKAAKSCARRRSGSFQQCMKKKLKRGRR